MPKKILIPVDFSEHSYKAIEYAINLNKLVYHDIDLLHVFDDGAHIFEDAIKNSEMIDPKVGSARRDMKKILSELVARDSELNVNVIFKDGSLTHEVHKLCATDEYEAIVMGTKGSSGLESLVAGSHMYGVFENTEIPVLAVPLMTKKIKIDKIGLLCNFKDAEIEVLKQAMKLTGKYIELVLIHINKENDDVTVLEEKLEEFTNKLMAATGIQEVSYVIKNKTFFSLYKENVSEAINSVADEEQIDLLLITKSKKGFLRKIKEENIVKRMAYHIKIPKFFAKIQ